MARQELGERKGANSKSEEQLADLWAVRLARKAGFDDGALGRALTRISDENVGSFSRAMTAMVDVHPLSDNRASAIEKRRWRWIVMVCRPILALHRYPIRS